MTFIVDDGGSRRFGQIRAGERGVSLDHGWVGFWTEMQAPPGGGGVRILGLWRIVPQVPGHTYEIPFPRLTTRGLSPHHRRSAGLGGAGLRRCCGAPARAVGAG